MKQTEEMVGAVRQTAGLVDTPNNSMPQRVNLVLILLVTLFVAYLDRVNVSVLVADAQFLIDMGIKGQPVKMGLVMSLFLFGYGISNIVLSPLGDFIGPRRAMMISIILWTIAVTMGGLATTFAVMLSARLILGIGEGMHWPMQSSFVKNWFPPNERGKANSAWLMGIMIGPAVAMPFFTWIVSYWGWRPTFFTLGVMGLVPLFLLWLFVTDHPSEHKRISKAELEYIESALKIEAEQEKAMKTETLGQRLASFCSNYRFWLLSLNYISISCIWWGMMAWLPSYLKASRGFSWASMGAWSAMPYVVGIICLWVFGHMSDKIGRRAPFVAIAHMLAAVGIYIGANVTDNVTAAVLISLGLGAIAIGLPATYSLVQSLVPGKAVGAAAGTMNGLSNIFSAFSPVIIGYFIAMSGSYMGGLMFLVGMALFGCVCMSILTLQKY